MDRVKRRRKHQYLIEGGAVPRSTEFSRRKKAAAKVAEAEKQGLQNSNEEFSNECHNVVENPLLIEDPNVYGNNDNGGVDELDNPVSSSESSIRSVPCSPMRNESAHHHYDILLSAVPSSEESSHLHEPASEDEGVSGDEEDLENDEEGAEAYLNYFPCDQNQLNSVFTTVPSSNGQSNEDPLLNVPLCPCSPTTQGDALLFCLALGIRHNLTWVAMVDILKMINLPYGYEAVTASKYYLQKLFYKQKTAKYHLYCSSCETYLGVKGDGDVEYYCECTNDTENSEQSTSFFVSIDLAEQFKSLTQKKEIADEILTYRFERKKLNAEAFEDIYDGEAYRTLCEDRNVLGNPCNFSYTFNTDGVQMGKSSKNTAWPIFLSINELSPRNRKKHTMFAGLWVGKTQPNMRIFLKPFVDEANKLSSEGFLWTDSLGNQCHSRVFPLCCVVDSAARYKLLNLSSYTCYYGCTFCYQRAENTKKGRRFTVLKNEAPLRTHESMIRDMNNVFKERNNPNKKNRIIKGCKGYTPLVLMNYLSLDTSFVVDSMHNSYLGCIKTHTGNLLSTFNTEYYIGSPDKKASLDDILCSICPPTTITRPPRTIDECKMWKASEWRSWLLLYVLVCLHSLIPNKYIHHIALFSTAIYLLLQRSVTLEDIQLANQYLRKFVFLTEVYFGKEALVYNQHLLLHICRGVINYGPIFTHNAFQFEGENHYFMQMRTGPGHAVKQLVMRYSVFAEYPSLCELYASSEEPLKFLNNISDKSLKSLIKQDGCVLVGKGKSLPFDSVKYVVLPLLTEQYQNAKVETFEKMIFEGVRYCNNNYAGGKKHDDSYISLGPNLKARIENILHITLNSELAVVILLVTPYKVRLPDFLRTSLVNVTHVKEIVRTQNIVAIQPSMILGQCVFIKSESRELLVDIPYGCYGD